MLPKSPEAKTEFDGGTERLRRVELLAASNRAFAELRLQKEEWKEELEERRDWEATLTDGLAGDDHSIYEN